MDDLGKSFPAAEGMVDAEQGSNKTHVNEFCLNCGTRLQDVYCHHCGQKDIPRRQTLRELIENFIGSFYSFESKFFRTVRFLLFKPGFLPAEYTAGKRESYYHPARAYVFISFVFFLLLFSLPDSEEATTPMTTQDKQEFEEGMRQMREGLKQAGLDSATIDSIEQASQQPDSTNQVITLGENKSIRTKRGNKGFSLTESEYKTRAEYDSAQATLPESERDGWFVRRAMIRAIELNQKYQGDDAGKRFGEDFSQAFLDNFSKVLFYLLPFFALLLKILYVRKDYFYSEHLVFTIYYYNFFYLAASLYLLTDLIPWIGGLLTTAIVIWIFLYLPLAMKRMYQQSWRKTIAKYFLFLMAFSVLLLLGFTGNILFIVFYL